MGGRRSAVNGPSAASSAAGASGPLRFGVRMLASATVARRRILPFFLDVAGNRELAVPVELAISCFVLVDPVLVAHGSTPYPSD